MRSESCMMTFDYLINWSASGLNVHRIRKKLTQCLIFKKFISYRHDQFVLFLLEYECSTYIQWYVLYFVQRHKSMKNVRVH